MTSSLAKQFARFVRSDKGATAVEYGLIAALITVALIGAIAATGSSNKMRWDNVEEQITNSTAIP